MISPTLVETKRDTDIVDISNQSSKRVRIVLELKRDADVVENLTNMLYKKTRLEIPLVSICWQLQTEDQNLGLKQIIAHHVDFVF